MPSLSDSSKAKLASCHPDLRRLFEEVIKYYDFTVICGVRSDFDQKKAFQEGKSKLDGVTKKSMHQTDKEHPFSRAIDVAPYPINWNDRDRFYHFAGRVQGIAQMMNIKIRWGGNWAMDDDLANNKFSDLPHFELL